MDIQVNLGNTPKNMPIHEHTCLYCGGVYVDPVWGCTVPKEEDEWWICCPRCWMTPNHMGVYERVIHSGS